MRSASWSCVVGRADRSTGFKVYWALPGGAGLAGTVLCSEAFGVAPWQSEHAVAGQLRRPRPCGFLFGQPALRSYSTVGGGTS